MPPKKLSKKELQEQRKAEAAKKEEQERKHREQAERKAQQLERQRKIEEEKRKEQERQRIEAQKKQYEPKLTSMRNREHEAVSKLHSQQNWSKYLQAQELPTVEGADLSTFISQYDETSYPNNEQILSKCQESETIASTLEDKCISYLAEKQEDKYKEGKEHIRDIRKITMLKLEDVIVNLAALADGFLQEKQLELTKKLSEVKKHDEKTVEDTIVFKSQSIKIGVFFNSSSAKNPFRYRPVEMKDLGVKSEIPSKLVNSNLIIKFEWTDFDRYSFSGYTGFNIVGGVLTIEFFDVLSNSKKMSSWTLKTDYQGREILDKSRITSSGQKEPFTITYQLPDYVYLKTIDKNTIRVAGWDGAKWAILPAETIKYDAVGKSLEFQVSRPGSVAYVQDRCTDYPYVSWELRSVAKNKIQLDLKGKREEFKIEIGENYARMVSNEPELQKLTQEGFTPERLLNEMKRIGINLLPMNEDYANAGITEKDSAAEEAAINDIAYAVCAFYVRSSPLVGGVAAKFKENLEYDSHFLEDQEKDWLKVNWQSKMCSFIGRKDNIDAHYNLELLLRSQEGVDPQCLNRMDQDEQFILKKTLIKFLRLTRILSFINDK